MRIKCLAILYLLLSFSSYKAIAQDIEHAFDEVFDQLLLDETTAEAVEETYQQLYNYYLQPINLNKTSGEELRELPFLNEFQIEQIMSYREEAGPFISIYELQSIPGIELQDIKRIVPFVAVVEKAEMGEPSNMFLFRYERDLQQRKGYSIREDGTTPYLGTPDKLLFQVRNTPGGKIQYGFNMEKDPGENIIYDRATDRYGLDHYSGFLKVNRLFNRMDLIVGDYQLQFGQGLVYSGGFSLGKSGGSLATYQRVSSGIRPHSSSAESSFHRGVAASVDVSRHFKFTGFYSSSSLDASISEATFSGFNTSGLHRTYGELAYRKSLKSNHYGAVLEYKSTSFNYGIGFSDIFLSANWIPSDRAYNSLAFQGDRLTTYYGYLTYQWNNISAFAETAYLHHGGVGFIGGSLFNLSSQLQTGFIYRNYQPDFSSIYGNALGEKSRNSNEKGLLWVINADFSRKLKMRMYLDTFSFPWLSYRISKPSDGYEYMVTLNYKPSKQTEFNLQYKREEKEQDGEQLTLTAVEKQDKQQYKAQLKYVISPTLEMRSSLQGSATSPGNNQGVAILQDVIYTRMKYKLIFRYSLFDTDDFANRQYVYENDVLYAFNFPALQGTGYKFYILAKYNLTRNIKCWIRFSHLTYTDRESISSGNEMIEGSRLSEVKFQCIYKF